jgi:uncharacterized protein (UPF0264 family)
MAKRERIRLMVSVTDLGEAEEALSGGADIIDVKNPREGALGANLPWITKTIREITPANVELSATIGDMPNLPGTAALAALGAAELGADYVKIGMLGPTKAEEVQEIAQTVATTLQKFDLEAKLVVSGYADYRLQGCVSPLLLPKVAAETGAWGVLIDVREKGVLGLLDHLSLDELRAFVDEGHRRNLNVALAGSLGKGDIGAVIDLGVDIVGVRRSVCSSEKGVIRVDERRVKEFARSLERAVVVRAARL